MPSVAESEPVVVPLPAPGRPAPEEFSGPAVTAQAPMPVPVPGAVPSGSGIPEGAQLWLTARDPYCLCAYWRVCGEALAAYAEANAGGGWWLRVRAAGSDGWLFNEEPLPRHADYRFVPVPRANASYVAEIGFRHADGSWRWLAASAAASTPPDRAEEFAEAVAVGGPPPVPMRHAEDPVPAAPMMPAHRIPPPPALPSPTQARRLVELIWEPVHSTEAPSSAEVAEWQAREVTTDLAEGGPGLPPEAKGSAAGAPASPVPVQPSSEAVPAPPSAPPDFWFNVNAELIIYGSTERDARVTIAGRPVSLRADGSFSFRFALPDGDFSLPAIAVNAAGTDGRSARLQFTRSTVLTGAVGVHPQDARLKPPVADAIG